MNVGRHNVAFAGVAAQVLGSRLGCLASTDRLGPLQFFIFLMK